MFNAFEFILILIIEYDKGGRRNTFEQRSRRALKSRDGA